MSESPSRETPDQRGVSAQARVALIELVLIELAEAVLEHQSRGGVTFSHRIHDALEAVDEVMGLRPSDEVEER